MPRPSTSAWTSCVPSYVFTASRFMQWRMTWYSSWMPLPPRRSLQVRAMSNALPQEFRFRSDKASTDALP